MKSQKVTNEKAWVETWMDSVASGRNKMSSRNVSSIEKRGGGLKAVAAAARKRKVHLVLLKDDKGQMVVAASIHAFKVLA